MVTKSERWSTAAHLGDSTAFAMQQQATSTTSTPQQQQLNNNNQPLTNRMESTNSDDGDYDLDERGNISTGVPVVEGGGGGANNGGNMEVNEDMLCQEVVGDTATTNNNTIEEGVRVVDDNNNEGNDEGSEVSSADKYADRNSDPGVDVNAEADYPFPSGNMEFGSGGLGGGLMTNDIMGNTNNDILHPYTTTMGLPPNPTPNNNTNNNNARSGETVSLGTATQTHEVRMPMLLSTFKPATGCTNASDFIVRCFVARLRSGITVVKHGRSRWCKSRLRVLHVHPDGRSLSWKPALGEPSSGKRPPKLDLTSCKEVRHAWSPDPDNPMFTGTPILRQKCEAANAHKSFALIFPKRTVDITAVTADQCKVLMEGFSALCFRLQVAQNVAASGGGGNNTTGGQSSGGNNKQQGGGDGGEDKATTASTNTSLNRQRSVPRRRG